MSISYYIKGVLVPDEKYLKMKQIFDLCSQSNIKPPSEVWDFFDGSPPTRDGQEFSITYREVNDNYRTFYEIDVKDIPEKTNKIRFVISY